MDEYIGNKDWYKEEASECPWKDCTCNAKPELRPLPICLHCILGSIRVQLEEVSDYFFKKNLESE